MPRTVTDAHLSGENAALRIALRETRRALREYQMADIRRHVLTRMADFDDFDRLIGWVNVIDKHSGRVDMAELELRITGLLRQKPHLAARVAGGDVGALS